METQTLIGMLMLGFSLGLLHAFDADHIMAVSVMTSKTRHMKSRLLAALITARYCMQWAFGHGGILLIIGGLLLAFDIKLPTVVADAAELAIGIFLIVMGGLILWQVRGSNIKLHVHQHGDIKHVHLADETQGRHNHQPLLVGMTHGLAGSAPVFALLPAIGSQNNWLLFGYLGLFSAGVLISMVVFGLFFGQLLGWIDQFGNRVFRISRIVLGSASIALGSYWLLS